MTLAFKLSYTIDSIGVSVYNTDYKRLKKYSDLPPAIHGRRSLGTRPGS